MHEVKTYSVGIEGTDQLYPWHPGSLCVRGWAEPQSWSGHFGGEKDLFLLGIMS